MLVCDELCSKLVVLWAAFSRLSRITVSVQFLAGICFDCRQSTAAQTDNYSALQGTDSALLTVKPEQRLPSLTPLSAL